MAEALITKADHGPPPRFSNIVLNKNLEKFRKKPKIACPKSRTSLFPFQHYTFFCFWSPLPKQNKPFQSPPPKKSLHSTNSSLNKTHPSLLLSLSVSLSLYIYIFFLKIPENRIKIKSIYMVMEECIIRDCMRKLGLWYTRTFNPFMTHDELEPIMAILGFVGLPPSNAWKEYAYLSKSFTVDQSPSPPRPRLPYPRVDGLHIYTYQAFIDAVDFYLNKSDISDLFHIRFLLSLHCFFFSLFK